MFMERNATSKLIRLHNVEEIHLQRVTEFFLFPVNAKQQIRRFNSAALH